MALSGSLKNNLAVVGVALAITAASIGVIRPLRDFYSDLVLGSQNAERVATLTNTANRLLQQQRIEEAQKLLTEALNVIPDDPSLEVQSFIIDTFNELKEAPSFDVTYNAGKHDTLIPLIARGLRLANTVSKSEIRSQLLAHIALLSWFDPVRPSLRHMESRLREAISLDQSNALAWTLLGLVLQQGGQDNEAILAFESSVQCDSEPGFAWANYARAQETRSDWAGALNSWLEVYKSNRPALSYSESRGFRERSAAQQSIKNILANDLSLVEASLPSLGMSAKERLDLIREAGLDSGRHSLVYARALAAAGQIDRAVKFAMQGINLEKSTNWRDNNEIETLGFLANLSSRLPEEEELRDKIQKAWQQLIKYQGLVEFPVTEVGSELPDLLQPDTLEVYRLSSGSPLFHAGLRPGDRIRAIAGQSVDSPENLAEMLELTPIMDSPLPILVEREFTPIVLTLKADASQ